MVTELLRCPFVRAVAEGRVAYAAELAARPPDPAEPVVVDWLIAEARRQIIAECQRSLLLDRREDAEWLVRRGWRPS